MATVNGHAAVSEGPLRMPTLDGEVCPECNGAVKCDKGVAHCFRCKAEYELPEARVVRGLSWNAPAGTVRETVFEVIDKSGLWAEPLGSVAKERAGILAWYRFTHMKLIRCKRETERILRRVIGDEP